MSYLPITAVGTIGTQTSFKNTTGAISGANLLTSPEFLDENSAQTIQNYFNYGNGELIKSKGQTELIGPQDRNTGDNITGTGGAEGSTSNNWINVGFITADDGSEGSVAMSGPNIVDLAAEIRKGGITVTNKATSSLLSTVSTNITTYGGPTDLWGTTWTASDINASNFEFAFVVNDGTNNSNVLLASNFGFSVPSYSTIVGIEVKIQDWRNTGTNQALVDFVSINVYYQISFDDPYSMIELYNDDVYAFANGSVVGIYRKSTDTVQVLKDDFTTSDNFTGSSYGDFFFLGNGGDPIHRIQPELGSEEVLNGGFSSGANWTLTGVSPPTITGGVLRYASSSSNFATQTLSGVVVGTTYILDYEIKASVAGHRFFLNTFAGIFIELSTDVGAHKLKIIAQSTTFQLRGQGSASNLDIDNVSVKEMTDTFEINEVSEAPKAKVVRAVGKVLYGGNTEDDFSRWQSAQVDNNEDWIPFTDWTASSSPPDADDSLTNTARHLGELTDIRTFKNEQLGNVVFVLHKNGYYGFTTRINEQFEKVIDSAFDKKGNGGFIARNTPEGMIFLNDAGAWLLSNPGIDEDNLTRNFGEDFIKGKGFNNGDIIYDDVNDIMFFASRDTESTKNIDQSQTIDAISIFFGLTSNQKVAQSFIPTDSNLTGITFRKGLDDDNYTGTLTISIQADSSGDPDGTDIVSFTYNNTEWKNLIENTDIIVPLIATLTISNTYWIVYTPSSITPSTFVTIKGATGNPYTQGALSQFDGATWATGVIDAYFKTHSLITAGNNLKLYKQKSGALGTNTVGDINRFMVDGTQLIGGGSDGKIYKLFDGTDDAGNDIISILKQELNLGSLDELKDLDWILAKGFFSFGGNVMITLDIYDKMGVLQEDFTTLTVTMPGSGDLQEQRIFKHVPISNFTRIILNITSTDKVAHKFTFLQLQSILKGANQQSQNLT